MKFDFTTLAQIIQCKILTIHFSLLGLINPHTRHEHEITVGTDFKAANVKAKSLIADLNHEIDKTPRFINLENTNRQGPRSIAFLEFLGLVLSGVLL